MACNISSLKDNVFFTSSDCGEMCMLVLSVTL